MASFAVESLCEQPQKGPLLALHNTQIDLHEDWYSGQNEQTNLSLITTDDSERPSVVDSHKYNSKPGNRRIAARVRSDKPLFDIWHVTHSVTLGQIIQSKEQMLQQCMPFLVKGKSHWSKKTGSFYSTCVIETPHLITYWRTWVMLNQEHGQWLEVACDGSSIKSYLQRLQRDDC